MSEPNKFWKNGKRTPEYRNALIAQIQAWMQGNPIHCEFSNECTPDFSCCVPSLMSSAAERAAMGEKFLMSLNDEEGVRN